MSFGALGALMKIRLQLSEVLESSQWVYGTRQVIANLSFEVTHENNNVIRGQTVVFVRLKIVVPFINFPENFQKKRKNVSY